MGSRTKDLSISFFGCWGGNLLLFLITNCLEGLVGQRISMLWTGTIVIYLLYLTGWPAVTSYIVGPLLDSHGIHYKVYMTTLF